MNSSYNLLHVCTLKTFKVLNVLCQLALIFLATLTLHDRQLFGHARFGPRKHPLALCLFILREAFAGHQASVVNVLLSYFRFTNASLSKNEFIIIILNVVDKEQILALIILISYNRYVKSKQQQQSYYLIFLRLFYFEQSQKVLRSYWTMQPKLVIKSITDGSKSWMMMSWLNYCTMIGWPTQKSAEYHAVLTQRQNGLFFVRQFLLHSHILPTSNMHAKATKVFTNLTVIRSEYVCLF